MNHPHAGARGRPGRTRTLLILLALAITLAAPAGASALGVPLNERSSMELRSHDPGPNAQLTADPSAVSWWLVGATAAAIIVSTFALALWTERRRSGDSGLDGGDEPSGGRPELPQPPIVPGGEDLAWSRFEAEFSDYVRSPACRRQRAGSR